MEIQNREAPAGHRERPRHADGLTPRQRKTAQAMLQSDCPLGEFLEEQKISPAEFTRWVLQTPFSAYVSALTTRMMGSYAPHFLHFLLETAQGGSVPAMKLYFELLGKQAGGEAAEASPDVEALRMDLFGDNA